MMKLRHSWLLLLGFLSFAAFALSLKPNCPTRYVVQEGDTLWDIAGKFLDKPWEWQEIWRSNPHIKNPKRLLPGAVIALKYYDGKPALVMVRRGTYRLSPQARRQPAYQAIPTIPLKVVKPFFNESLVLDREQFQNLSYVAGVDGEHIVASPGIDVFVRFLPPAPTPHYGFYRFKHKYYDHERDELLGILADYIGSGDVVAVGEPSTLTVKEAVDSVQARDYVMPNTPDNFDLFFDPRAPSKPVHGLVLDFFSAVKDLGTHQVLVVDKGKRDGLRAGDVLAIYRNPEEILDVVAYEPVVLPPKRVGEVMIFRPFEKVSFGLVMTATQPIQKFYIVENP